jgi:hypothetical protein
MPAEQSCDVVLGLQDTPLHVHSVERRKQQFDCREARTADEIIITRLTTLNISPLQASVIRISSCGLSSISWKLNMMQVQSKDRGMMSNGDCLSYDRACGGGTSSRVCIVDRRVLIGHGWKSRIGQHIIHQANTV